MCNVSQERLLDYAASVDPHSRPTAVKKLVPEVQYTPRQNPVPAGFDPLAPPEHQPPVPEYKVRTELPLESFRCRSNLACVQSVFLISRIIRVRSAHFCRTLCSWCR